MDKYQPWLTIQIFIDTGFGVYHTTEGLKIIVDIYAVRKSTTFYKCLFFSGQ
jgi:hypothetical protein